MLLEVAPEGPVDRDAGCGERAACGKRKEKNEGESGEDSARAISIGHASLVLHAGGPDHVTELRTLVSNLNAGKGTAGKLLNDDGLHNRLVATLDRLNSTLDKVNGGQGTIGQLMVNPQLYDSATGVSRELNSLLADVHKNPKKFLTIRLTLF